MIEDSKFVKSVASNTPKKGWKITWQDDKYDNIFNEAWLSLLDQAQKGNLLVHYQKEKNEAGYWNIKELTLATDTPPATTPQVQPVPTEDGTQPTQSNPKNRAFALSYQKDIVVALINVGILKEMTTQTYEQMLIRANRWASWMDGVD